MIAPRHFRILVVLLAAGYTIEVAVTADYSAFGAQFRFLTIWALTGNLLAAVGLLSAGHRMADAQFDTALSVLAIINALVVFSYWRLFFIDPALINGSNTPKPYREYYLHLIGPVLMWVDLFWLRRGFRRVLPVLGWLAIAVLSYVGWAEMLVGPLNAAPVGDVTSGLPYPFLNDMDPLHGPGSMGRSTSPGRCSQGFSSASVQCCAAGPGRGCRKAGEGAGALPLLA